MKAMVYKGYAARVEFDADDAVFAGRIAGISHVVGFHAESVPELIAAFHEAVDDYLETCAKVGKEPQRAYSGNLMLADRAADPCRRRVRRRCAGQEPEPVERGGAGRGGGARPRRERTIGARRVSDHSRSREGRSMRPWRMRTISTVPGIGRKKTMWRPERMRR